MKLQDAEQTFGNEISFVTKHFNRYQVGEHDDKTKNDIENL